MPKSPHGRSAPKSGAGRLYIGTSGWSYEDWRGVLYPSDLPSRQYLAYYAQQFTATEINSTFHHLLEAKQFRAWADEVPADFRFAVKLSRYVTHIKRLKDCREPFATFLSGTQALKRRMGPILVQLPPNFKIDEERLAKFLSNTQEARHECGVRKRLRFAFEFRHRSWFADTPEREELLTLLRRHNCAFVFGHSRDYPYPDDEPVTADFVYLRLHGPGEMCASSYTSKELEVWAPRIHDWLNSGRDVYVFFNNDANGYAVENARLLKEAVAVK